MDILNIFEDAGDTIIKIDQYDNVKLYRINDLRKIIDLDNCNVYDYWCGKIHYKKNRDVVNARVEELCDYYDQFKEVDTEEEAQAILIAIQASNKIPSKKFVTNLLKLATFDHNMKIRDTAIKTLDKTYNRKI